MVDFIIAIGSIMILMAGWLAIQHLARNYSLQHPEFGAPKEEGSGCGKSCLCSNGSCKNKKHATTDNHNSSDLFQEDQQHDLP